MSGTTLLVPVPEAEPATSRWWPLWEPAKARGIPAHVSVLYPFLPTAEVDDRARALVGAAAASVAAFDYELAAVARFPSTVYLAPEPAAGFVALTSAIEERFPGVEPYRGEHSRVVPHVTVLTSPDPALRDRVADEVRRELPLAARAAELWLMGEREEGGWETLASFPLA